MHLLFGIRNIFLLLHKIQTKWIEEMSNNMRMATVASGSSGNCIYVGSDETHILIDAGISKKRTEVGLRNNEIDLKDISGIMITHEHIDHINGLGVISRKYEIPIYATADTLKQIENNKKIGEIPSGLYREIKPDVNYRIGDLEVCPFHISHDAADPVGYRINCEDKSVAVATDMGKYDDYIISKLQGLDAIVIEANHDVNMLLAGSYPYHLKQRILGDRGHLSNEASGRLINDILNDKIKKIFLGHLSKENNFAELAYETVRSEIIMSDNEYKADDFDIQVAGRDVNSDLVFV